MNKVPAGILLAAGQSARFGSNKLLHPVTGNRPMLLVSAEKLASVLHGSIVIINERLIPFTAQLEQMGLHVVVNEQAQQGMGSSIACGVDNSQDASGWLIMLADMPYLKTETIRRLADKLEYGAKMVAPIYKKQRGHPVGFNQCYKNELLALNKDTGARQVIKNHQSQLELVAVNDAGTIMDVDHASDVRSESNYF
jgi:molybdenum cofactor cytidylyltransferase